MDTFLIIVFFVFGVLYVVFGAAIYFLKKYTLINGFEEEKKQKKIDDKHADIVGLINLVGGIVFIILGVVSIFVSAYAKLIMLLISVLIFFVSFIINKYATLKRVNKKN